MLSFYRGRYAGLSLLLLLLATASPPECLGASLLSLPTGRAAPDSEAATISGFVRDSATGEPLIGARISVRALKKGAVTNIAGYFLLRLPAEKPLEIEYYSPGFDRIVQRVRLKNGEEKEVAILLTQRSVQGEEVIVETDRSRDREAPQVSRITIDPAALQSMPKAGEADLFRTLQLLPGVQTSSEISSGLYIRGGSPDQNLILLDGSVLYNPSHFFGFFSTFNTDAIKSVELIKGGYPAEYGGRLSAVLNVTNRDGDKHNMRGKFSLGLISSRITLETPLALGSLSLSARRTYVDAILRATGLKEKLDLPDYKFYDLNGKLTQDISNKDKLTLNGYLGRDALDYSSTANGSTVLINWGNQTGSASWTHIFGTSLFSKFNLSSTRYYSNLTLGVGAENFIRDNAIIDYTLNGDLQYFHSDDHEFRLGAQATLYHITFQVRSGSNPPNANIDVRPNYMAAYLQDEWKLSERASVNGGLRAEKFSVHPEINLDPRLSFRYILNSDVTLKASAGIYHQYLQLAFNPNFSFFDIWLPSDSTQPPSRAEQYVLGISTVPFGGYTLEIEGYFKNMHNLVELQPNIIAGKNLSDVFFVGNGKAYGLEFFLKKEIGPITGWIGYALAWTRRKFPDINNGKEFAPTYDRRNDVNVVVTHRLSPSWTIGSTFVYATGQAYTQNSGIYQSSAAGEDGGDVVVPGDRNNARLEPYNRLDLSATYSFSLLSDKKNAEFNIDIYNVYNHRNVWFKQTDASTNPAAVNNIRLLPILPTFSLSVSF